MTYNNLCGYDILWWIYSFQQIHRGGDVSYFISQSVVKPNIIHVIRKNDKLWITDDLYGETA